MSMDLRNIIIDPEKIYEVLAKKTDSVKIDDILTKALELKGLDYEEASALLNVEDEETLDRIFHTAKKVKEEIYGNRIVLFAPLYTSNECVNNCAYCGFRTGNKELRRRTLTVDETIAEAEQIIKMGHKRMLLVAGEHPVKSNLDFVKEVIDKIYEKKLFNGEIRRLNLNLAPLSIEEFKRLSTFGIGSFQVFQETYDPILYKKMHLAGPKADYNYRLEVWDRYLQAGLHDFGVGALFGLGDFKFEVLGILMHANYLLNKYGVGPHTISVPRIEYADGSDIAKKPPHAVSDKDFKKIVAVLRLSVPYTGMILTTRETAQTRHEVIELGISQVSAGSKTNPGGYSEDSSTEQFSQGDHRDIDSVIQELCNNGYLPSFCTSCYRTGRVGKDFMDLAIPGLIKKFCQPNAISTFTEFLEDYALPETKEVGYKCIEKSLNEIEDEKVKIKTTEIVKTIKEGKRDLFI